MTQAALVRALQTFRAADALPLDWTESDWRSLGQHLQRRTVAAGEVLIRHQAVEPVMHLVQSGLFQVYLPTVSSARRPVAILRPGSVVGELALFTDQPRLAQVDAMADSVVWQLSSDAFQSFTAQAPGQAFAFLRACGAVMAARLRANFERGLPTA